MNTLYYGDNLEILREYIHADSVDLIYLDPPFNSARNFNILFSDKQGKPSEAQVQAFEDTWEWNQTAAATYHYLITQCGDEISQIISAIRQIAKEGPMLAYLVMMAARLIELHRVLKPTGSLYLHCDQTASSYLRVLLDAIFGPRNFRTEIIWKRTNTHSDSKTWSKVSDTIYFYTKSDTFTWNAPWIAHSDKHVEAKYSNKDESGRPYTLSDMTSPNPRPNMMYDWKGFASPINGWRYQRDTMATLDAEGRVWYPTHSDGTYNTKRRPRLKRYLENMKGTLLGNVWTDIDPINSQAAERLGYPTQKPMTLLERIINASSNPGDLVLDPFCGCGTAVAAAQRLGRQWAGIDITSLAIALIKSRMEAMFPGIVIKTIGEPKDLDSARQLAQDDRYQFQWWALSLIPARPLGGDGGKAGKKGSDRGIDGVINFVDDTSAMPKRVLIQVKSGHVKSGDIRDLVGTVQREKAAIGVFVTLEPASKDMTTEAVTAGFYHSDGWGKDYPKIQILTITDLLRGAQVLMPPAHATFKTAKVVKPTGGNVSLDFGNG